MVVLLGEGAESRWRCKGGGGGFGSERGLWMVAHLGRSWDGESFRLKMRGASRVCNGNNIGLVGWCTFVFSSLMKLAPMLLGIEMHFVVISMVL
jgi:hypothetical protein